MGTNIPKVVALELKDTLQNFSLSLSSLVMKRLPTAERSQHKTKKNVFPAQILRSPGGECVNIDLLRATYRIFLLWSEFSVNL